MRITQMTPKECGLVETALVRRNQCFDPADIYGGGKVKKFGTSTQNRPDSWDKNVDSVQSGNPHRRIYLLDSFSEDENLEATDGILQRFGRDHLDSLPCIN